MLLAKWKIFQGQIKAFQAQTGLYTPNIRSWKEQDLFCLTFVERFRDEGKGCLNLKGKYLERTLCICVLCIMYLWL